MKKNIVFILIFIFLFSFSCTVNLFEGTVESNYNAIKDPAQKIEYARQILAGGDKDKIAKIIELLKADINNNKFSGDNLAAANQIVGNLLISQSGFNDVVSNVISQLVTSSSGSSGTTNIVTSIVDPNGDGNITTEDLSSLQGMLETLAQAATYINNAAQAQPQNLDLQLQNVIANLAAAATNIIDFNNPDNTQTTIEQLQQYFSGQTNTPPPNYNQIQTNVNNIVSSVNNLLQYSQQGSVYYEFAQTLNQIFSNVIS